MIDITSLSADLDLTIMEAQTPKAANVLQVQLGDLEYAPDFGIDLDFFLAEDLTFQNESFKAYLVQRLSEHNVNVNAVRDVLTRFTKELTFEVGPTESQTGGFIR